MLGDSLWLLLCYALSTRSRAQSVGPEGYVHTQSPSPLQIILEILGCLNCLSKYPQINFHHQHDLHRVCFYSAGGYGVAIPEEQVMMGWSIHMHTYEPPKVKDRTQGGKKRINGQYLRPSLGP